MSEMTGLGYDVSGPAGAPVVVLGGSLGTTRDMWLPQLDALARRYRVVRFDHRGHGGSPVPPGPYALDDLGRDVLALLDALGLARVHYCGLSLGGMVGMWLAAHAPERVDRLVLLCTSAHLPPADGWRVRAALVRDSGTGAVADAVLGRWFTPDFPPDRAAGYRAMLTGTPAEGYAGCCEAVAAMDLRPVLPAIAADTLVVAGADDPAIPLEHAVRIAGAVPRARCVVLPGAAHLASVEQPGQVARLILEHLAGDRYAQGMAVRRQVLGDAHVDRAVAATDGFTADFQDLITRYAWGEIWTRDGLDRRTRSCVTLALLAALRFDEELAMHVRAALRNGLTPDEIKEVLLQVAVYAGVPAANTAFAVARRALADTLAEPTQTEEPA